MGMFEYVVVLTGVVIGLALAHLMQGIARIIERPTRVQIWWVHLGWVFYMIIFAVFWWWFEFRLRLVGNWSFQLYGFVLVYAFFIYLICALLFPNDITPHESFEGYFIARRRWFFGMLIAWRGIDLVDTLAKGSAYFKSLGPEYPIGTAVTVGLFSVGLISPRGRVQAAVMLIALAYAISWIARVYDFAR